MHIRASQRYQTATAFAEDLKRWLEGKPILARPSSTIENAWRWAQRNKRVAALATTIFGLLMAIAVGGVLSTISIANAKNALANQTAAALESSARAQQASRDAIAANRSAQEQRQLALDSLNSLVDQVQTKLANRPGTVKLREELLRSAIAGLDRVTSGDDQTSIDHASINARIQMASLKSILGDSDGAREDAEKVIGLASQRIVQSPDDPIALRDYALSLGLSADSKRRVFAFEEAKPIYQEIMGIYQRLKQYTPNDFSTLRECISTEQKLADIELQLLQPESARVQLQKSLDEIVAIKERFPERPELERDHYSALAKLSAAHAALGLSNVVELQTQAISIAERLSNQDLENTLYAADVANLLARVARREIAQNNSMDALLVAKRALHKYEECAARDPNNLQAQMYVGTALDLLSQAYLIGGELEQANAAETAGFNAYVRLMELDPKKTLYLILAMETADRISGLYFRMANFPQTIEWSQKSIAFLDKCRLREDYSPSTFEPVREVYAAFLESVRSLTSEGYKKSLSVNDTWGQAVRSSVESYLCAQRGEHAEAFLHASRVRDVAANREAPTKSDLQVHFPKLCCGLAARSIAISHRRLIHWDVGVETTTLPSSEHEIDKYKELAIALLNFANKNQPGSEASWLSEPDLAGLVHVVRK